MSPKPPDMPYIPIVFTLSFLHAQVVQNWSRNVSKTIVKWSQCGFQMFPARDEHGQAQTSTDKHRQTRHGQTQTDKHTDRHKEEQTDTNRHTHTHKTRPDKTRQNKTRQDKTRQID